MEPIAALELATSSFVNRLDEVPVDMYAAPTPCEGWSVEVLLEHLAQGARMTVAMLDGASADEARAVVEEPLEGDAVEVCRREVLGQLARMAEATDPDAIVHHLIGDIPVSQLFNFRIADLLIHSWDLSRSLGLAEELPGELVELVYENLKPMEPMISQIGIFGDGPSGALDDEIDLQTKLLDLSGRRP